MAELLVLRIVLLFAPAGTRFQPAVIGEKDRIHHEGTKHTKSSDKKYSGLRGEKGKFFYDLQAATKASKMRR